jgi:hypothetical protein
VKLVDRVVTRVDDHGGTTYLNRWHQERYAGQAERFERVRRCGEVTHKLEGYDPNTGELVRTEDFERRCGNWRVCNRCLKNRRFKLSRDVLRARERALALRRFECSSRYHGPEGRWSERLITLTVPHSGDAGVDAGVLSRGWAEMQRRLLDHLKRDRGALEKPVWVRAMEVAPSDDGGHAHLHLWWVGPFVDHVWLRVTWGRVLEGMGVECPQKPWSDAMQRLRDQRVKRWCRTRRGDHGRQPSELPWPHVYVNKTKGDEGAASYATKVGVAFYVTKGTDVQRMHPLHAASVYQAFEGRRAVQWARGWAPKVQSELWWHLRRMSTSERADWLEGLQTRVSSVATGETWPIEAPASSAEHRGGSTCTTVSAHPVGSQTATRVDVKTNGTTRRNDTSQRSFDFRPPSSG